MMSHANMILLSTCSRWYGHCLWDRTLAQMLYFTYI